MQELLSFGRSIREFQNQSPQAVFVNADTYPAFFDKHLVHPCRKIKVFLNDPNANLRAFYFQYLILCFEIENPNFQFYIEKLQRFVLDPHFSFLFLEDDDENIFNDKQFKRFLLEFMQILDSQELDSVEETLNRYPIADLVFVYFFRSLAIYAQITTDFDSYIDKNVLFGFLLDSFAIDAAVFQQKCLKFFEAEVYVYEESPQKIYLVYKEPDNESQNLNSKSGSKNSKIGRSFHSSQVSHKEQPVKQDVSVLEDYDNSAENINQSFRDSSGFKKQKDETSKQQLFVSKPPINQYVQKPVSPIGVSYPLRDPKTQTNKYEQELKDSAAYRSTRANTTNNRELEAPIHKTTATPNSYNFAEPLTQLTTPTLESNSIFYDPNSRKTSGYPYTQTWGERKEEPLTPKTKMTETIMHQLNISKEFTDSLTLAKMGEPFKSSIQRMKSRSRTFRQSLLSSLK